MNRDSEQRSSSKDALSLQLRAIVATIEVALEASQNIPPPLSEHFQGKLCSLLDEYNRLERHLNSFIGASEFRDLIGLVVHPSLKEDKDGEEDKGFRWPSNSDIRQPYGSLLNERSLSDQAKLNDFRSKRAFGNSSETSRLLKVEAMDIEDQEQQSPFKTKQKRRKSALFKPSRATPNKRTVGNRSVRSNSSQEKKKRELLIKKLAKRREGEREKKGSKQHLQEKNTPRSSDLCKEEDREAERLKEGSFEPERGHASLGFTEEHPQSLFGILRASLQSHHVSFSLHQNSNSNSNGSATIKFSSDSGSHSGLPSPSPLTRQAFRPPRSELSESFSRREPDKKI